MHYECIRILQTVCENSFAEKVLLLSRPDSSGVDGIWETLSWLFITWDCLVPLTNDPVITQNIVYIAQYILVESMRDLS